MASRSERRNRWIGGVGFALAVGLGALVVVPRLRHAPTDGRSPGDLASSVLHVPPSAHFLIGLGTPHNGAGEQGGDLAGVAHQALLDGLQSHPEALFVDDSAAVGRAVGHSHRLSGYFLDASIESVTVQPTGAVRATVSLLVQTNPGREYRFETESSVSVGSHATDPSAQNVAIQNAVRAASQSALDRALQQMQQGT